MPEPSRTRTKRGSPIRPVSAVVALALSACVGGEEGGDVDFAVTDSAGVEVVRNGSKGAWGDSLRMVELVRIGVVEGQEELQFFRISDVAVDAADTFFVAVGGASEIRVFAPDGRFVRKMGRQGEGPGEFGSLGGLLLAGDTIIAGDSRQQRMTLLDRSGGLIDTWRNQASLPPEAGGSVTIVPLMSARGGWIAHLSRPFAPDRNMTGRVYVDTTRLAFIGSVPEAVAAFAGAASDTLPVRVVLEYGGTRLIGREIRAGRVGPMRPLWAPTPSHAVDANGQIHLSHGLPYRIETFDHTGRLLRVLSRRDEPRPIDDALIADYLAAFDAYYATADVPLERKEQALAEARDRANAPHEPFVAPLGTLYVSDGGAIWAERLDLSPKLVDTEMRETPRAPPVFDLFDPDGRFLGTVQLPEAFRPYSFGTDWVAGMIRDELEVEYVVRFRLQR